MSKFAICVKSNSYYFRLSWIRIQERHREESERDRERKKNERYREKNEINREKENEEDRENLII